MEDLSCTTIKHYFYSKPLKEQYVSIISIATNSTRLYTKLSIDLLADQAEGISRKGKRDEPCINQLQVSSPGSTQNETTVNYLDDL